MPSDAIILRGVRRQRGYGLPIGMGWLASDRAVRGSRGAGRQRRGLRRMCHRDWREQCRRRRRFRRRRRRPSPIGCRRHAENLPVRMRGSQVDCLIQEAVVGHPGGSAGRKVGQLCVVESDLGQCGDCERIAAVVMEQQSALRRVGGSVKPWQAKWAIAEPGHAQRQRSWWKLPGRCRGPRKSAAASRGAASALGARPLQPGRMPIHPLVDPVWQAWRRSMTGLLRRMVGRRVWCGHGEGTDGWGVRGDDPFSTVRRPGPVGSGVVAGGVDGQQAERPAGDPPQSWPRLSRKGLFPVAECIQHWPGRVVP